MKTLMTVERYQWAQVVGVFAIVVVMWIGEMVFPTSLWAVFFLISACLLGWWLRQWTQASEKSFVVKDDKVLCEILGPCMVWMRGAMKGCKVVNYQSDTFVASIEVITGTPLHGGNLVVTTLSVTTMAGGNMVMLQDYWDCLRRRRLSETAYMERSLRAFQGTEYELFFGQVQRSGRVGTCEWISEDLLPRLNAYLLREMRYIGLTVVTIKAEAEVMKSRIYGKKEKEEQLCKKDSQ